MPAQGTRDELLEKFQIGARTFDTLVRRGLLDFHVSISDGRRVYMAKDQSVDDRLELARATETELVGNSEFIHFPFHRYMLYLVFTGKGHAFDLLTAQKFLPPRRMIAGRPVFFGPKRLAALCNAIAGIAPELKSHIEAGVPPTGKTKTRRKFDRLAEVIGLGDLDKTPEYLDRFLPIIDDPELRLAVDRVMAINGTAKEVTQILALEGLCSLSVEDVLVYRHLFMDREAFRSAANRQRLWRRYPAATRRALRESIGTTAKQYIINAEITSEIADELDEMRLRVRNTLLLSSRLDGVDGIKLQLDCMGKYMRIASEIENFSKATTKDRVKAASTSNKRIPLTPGDDADLVHRPPKLMSIVANTGV